MAQRMEGESSQTCLGEDWVPGSLQYIDAVQGVASPVREDSDRQLVPLDGGLGCQDIAPLLQPSGK